MSDDTLWLDALESHRSPSSTHRDPVGEFLLDAADTEALMRLGRSLGMSHPAYKARRSLLIMGDGFGRRPDLRQAIESMELAEALRIARRGGGE